MAELKTLLARVKAAVSPYFVHASGQALAWYTVATHDVGKWEAAAAVAGTAILTSGIKKVSAWLGSPAAK